MKVSYRGYEINAHSEKCLGGWEMLYFSIYRESDGYECVSGFSEDSTPPHEYIEHLKQRVDHEIESGTPFEEQ